MLSVCRPVVYPVPTQTVWDFEKLLFALNKLRSDFERLWRRIAALEENEMLANQSAQVRLDGDIVQQYEILCGNYEAIMRHLAQSYFPEGEIIDIDKTTAQASHSLEVYSRLRFFPAFQRVYDENNKIRFDGSRRRCDDLHRLSLDIHDAYERRVAIYLDCIFAYSIFSVLVVGLPFLAVTAAIYLIDYLVTSIKLHHKREELTQVWESIHRGETIQLQEMQCEVLKRPSDRLCQTFFTVSKARYEPDLAKLEQLRVKQVA